MFSRVFPYYAALLLLVLVSSDFRGQDLMLEEEGNVGFSLPKESEDHALSSVNTQPEAENSSEPLSVEAIPAAPAEEKVEVPPVEQEQDEIVGIDTMGLEEPRGNWLFKRIWWERSEQQYDKIREMVEKINDLRMQFFARRTELEKTVFDPFFVDTGFNQGELSTVLASLIERIEEGRKKIGSLNEQERELLDIITKDREMVEQLHRDTQGIALLEHTADMLIERVMEQKSQVSRYEREAWDNMKEIARILSDTKARELYYKVDASWRNIKNVHRYIEQDLQRSMNQLMASAKEHTDRIKSAMQTLKEKGIDLKRTVTQVSEEVDAAACALQDNSSEEATPLAKKSASSGILATILNPIQAFFRTLLNALTWIPRTLWKLIKG